MKERNPFRRIAAEYPQVAPCGNKHESVVHGHEGGDGLTLPSGKSAVSGKGA
jgi:hypothetical protein